MHLYPARDAAISRDAIQRGSDAGLSVLVITVDNPISPNRERDTRAGFSMPLRLRADVVLESLLHPAWLLDYFGHGGFPRMESWARYAPAGTDPPGIANFFRSQSPSVQTWHDLEEFRRLWRGRLILKGIQHPDDALMAQSAGVDGIIVSNHGGKAFDPLPSPLDTLPAVREAVGDRMVVMFDSGIRRGSDIVIARCLGADFTFIGRAAIYGVAAGAEAGATRAIEILRREIDLALGLIGCPEFTALGPAHLFEREQPDQSS
jgi:L-lactate dehydrogenase (cytochrome)/(S)-mandelate dehydrogenase